MSSTPLIDSSSGVATVSARVSAVAPGKEAETTTVGGAISGYWATGRVGREMAPASTIRIDSTAAKIGLSMKKWGKRMPAYWVSVAWNDCGVINGGGAVGASSAACGWIFVNRALTCVPGR